MKLNYQETAEFAEMVLRARLVLAMTPEKLCAHVTGIVASYYGVTMDRLRGRSRASEYAYPRFLAMRILRERGLSFDAIGEFFNRERSMIGHACRRVDKLAKTIAEFKKQLSELMEITK